MMFTWSNQLTLNNVKTVLQVRKKTHKAQRARYRRYNVTCSADYFQQSFFQTGIGHLQVAVCLCFKASPVHNLSSGNDKTMNV